MALNTYVFVDEPSTKEKAYFLLFRNNPMGPGFSTDPGMGLVEYKEKLWVNGVWPINKMSLMELLYQVGNRRSDGVMIVCHGDQKGLHLPLVPGGKGWNIGTTEKGWA